MTISLQDKIVFISGASSGIGAACVRVFAKHRAKVIISARREERLKALVDELKEMQASAHLLRLDVRDRMGVQKAIDNLPSSWRDIDILINNAGMVRGLDKFQAANIDDWEEMIDTNIKGLLYVTRAILPVMMQRNSGHIINIGSIAGHEVYAGGGVYCATKHAVLAINKGLKLDLLGTDIKVSSVDPGMVETEFSEVRFRGDKERAKKVYAGMKPLVAADIADAVYYCASRPKHVNVLDMILVPTSQSAATQVHRSDESPLSDRKFTESKEAK